jgi:N-acetyltransferase 10
MPWPSAPVCVRSPFALLWTGPGAAPFPALQVLALFNKAVRKLHSHLRAAKEAAIARALPRPSAAPRLAPAPGEAGLDEELEEAAAEVKARLRAEFDPAELAQYAVTGMRRAGGSAFEIRKLSRRGRSSLRRASPSPPPSPSCERFGPQQCFTSASAPPSSQTLHPGADEDFARALGGAAPGSGGIVQVKSSGGGGGDGSGGSGSAKKGSSSGGEAMLYKKGSGKKHKSPGGGGGGKSAKKAKKG